MYLFFVLFVLFLFFHVMFFLYIFFALSYRQDNHFRKSFRYSSVKAQAKTGYIFLSFLLREGLECRLLTNRSKWW